MAEYEDGGVRKSIEKRTEKRLKYFFIHATIKYTLQRAFEILFAIVGNG